MTNEFYINGLLWRVEYVDPMSDKLIDRSYRRTVGVCYFSDLTIYLSTSLRQDQDFLLRVFVHELGHAIMLSYDMLDIIHKAVYPEHWITAEEWICNFIADYGLQVFSIARQVLGDKTWGYVLYEMERVAKTYNKAV